MKKIIILTFIFISILSFGQTEETIISGDTKLHYKSFGKGKPILIINGGPGMNSDGFAFIAEEISKFGYQTIIYDQRGTGKSTLHNVNSETITMDLMVDDIEILRKHLKIQKWTIFGHSFGGILGTYYAFKHPEAIDKLILSSSGGVNLKFLEYVSERMNNNLTKSENDSLALIQEKFNSGDRTKELLEARANIIANAYVYDKTNASIIAKRLTQINFEINSLVFENLQKIKFDCSKEFKKFKNPVLVIQGKNDIISTETAKEINATFPNSDLIILDKCAHYGWLDSKEIYLNSIQEFLKK
ncbi:alpha/beta fold hydrolase [Flavobacterium sp. LMO8]|uniref:alpha/beta fold hydrolase n=1 Tax=Flavobacterium sp. LMO8 TaxID=2654244 RepID=UPI0012909248|nr:alpha/beta hydrolase [Flavobacterium sp. LMO8]MQP24195.1 alpha/beta fold hydrolase [Flavobacterium sp. LMO8]